MFEFIQTVQLVADNGDTTTLQPGRVSNKQIAEVLHNIATLLEMQQANPYRIAAYRNAANRLTALPFPLALAIIRGAQVKIPGIGERLTSKITELVRTGRMTFYDDLCEESLPEDVRSLMAVPRVGPRTALRLAGQLNIHNVEELQRVASAGKLREHYGFGVRSERALAEGARAVLEGRVLPPTHELAATGVPELAPSLDLALVPADESEHAALAEAIIPPDFVPTGEAAASSAA